MFDPNGASILYAVAISALSLVGWLVFGVPVALRSRRGASHPLRTVVYGGLTGALLVTLAYTFLFHGQQYAVRGSVLYEVSAIVNAATSTATCLWLLRRRR